MSKEKIMVDIEEILFKLKEEVDALTAEVDKLKLGRRAHLLTMGAAQGLEKFRHDLIDLYQSEVTEAESHDC